MRFDLHYDDGPNGPRWQPIIILIIGFLAFVTWSLIQAIWGR